MSTAIRLLAAALLVVVATPAFAKQGLLHKAPPVPVAPAVLTALPALPGGATAAGASPGTAGATTSSPAIAIAPGLVDPGADVKPMPLPACDLPLPDLPVTADGGGAAGYVQPPWAGGGFVPGAVGGGAAEGVQVVTVMPGEFVPEGAVAIGLADGAIPAGDMKPIPAIGGWPASPPGGGHHHAGPGNRAGAPGMAVMAMATGNAPAAGANAARAPAGGWPGRAAGMRGEGIGPMPSHGRAAAATAPARQGQPARPGEAPTGRGATARVTTPASAAAGAAAAAKAPSWRERLRWASPLSR